MKIIAYKPDVGQEYSNPFKEQGIYPFSKIGRVIVNKDTGKIKRWCAEDNSNYEECDTVTPEQYYDNRIVRIIQAENGKLVEWDKNNDMQIVRTGDKPLDNYIVAQGDWGTVYSDGSVNVSKLAPNTVNEYNIALAQLEEIQGSGIDLLNEEGYIPFNFENQQDHETLINDINNSELSTMSEEDIETLVETTIPTPLKFGCFVNNFNQIYCGSSYENLLINKAGYYIDMVENSDGIFTFTRSGNVSGHFRGFDIKGKQVGQKITLQYEVIEGEEYFNSIEFTEEVFGEKKVYTKKKGRFTHSITNISNDYCIKLYGFEGNKGETFKMRLLICISPSTVNIPYIPTGIKVPAGKLYMNTPNQMTSLTHSWVIKNYYNQAFEFPLDRRKANGEWFQTSNHFGYDSIISNTVRKEYLSDGNNRNISVFNEGQLGTTPNEIRLDTSYGTTYDRINIYEGNLTEEELIAERDKQILSLVDFRKPINLDIETEEVMVHIPAFYCKRTWEGEVLTDSILTKIPDSLEYQGYEVHPAFVRTDGSIRSYVLVGAFLGIYDTQLRSIPTTSALFNQKSISAFRDLARQGRTTKFNIIDIMCLSAIQILYKIAFQNLNSQLEIRSGSKLKQQKVGSTMSLGNRSGYLDDGISQVSLFGIEDMWSNYYTIVDGVFAKGDGYYISSNPDDYGDISKYTHIETTVVSKDGYYKHIEKIDGKYSVINLPDTNTDFHTNVSEYYCDHNNRINASPAILLSSQDNTESKNGLFYINFNAGTTNTWFNVGTRLCYLP